MQILKNFARLSSAAIVAISAIAHAQVAPPALPVPPSQDAPALAAPAALQAKIDLDQLEKSIFPNDNKPLAFNHILVPLEAFTVQRINNNATKFFKSENVVMAKNSKGEAVYYTVNENARDLFSFLLDKKYKITVFSGLEAGVRDTILNAISLPRSNNVALSKVVKTGEIDWTDKLNIKDFGDVNSTIAIGYKGLDVKPADQVIDAGPYFIPFSDYKSMERFRPKGGDESYAQDEQAWKAERFKIARVMFTLKQTNQDDKATFKAKLQEVNKTSAAKLSDYGVAISGGKWTRLQFAWDISADNKSVQGCSIQDKVDGKTIRSVDIDNCKAALGTKSKLAIDKKTQRATACEIFTKSGVKIESSNQPGQCILGLGDDGLAYAVEYSSQRCAVFTVDGEFISHLKTEELCGKKTSNAIYDKSTNAWLMYQSFQGMEKLSEAALIKRVGWGWDPRSPLKFQYSLLSMTVSDDNNKVNSSFPAACVAAVKKVISSGGHLASKVVLKNSLPVEKFPRPDTADNTFFHYTKSGTAFDAVQAAKSYGSFFEFVRVKMDYLWQWVFYVAADDSSSDNYGNNGYKFTLKPRSIIFYVQGDMPGVDSKRSAINTEVANELIQREPDLAACNKELHYSNNFTFAYGMNLLTTLAAESSGVAAIAYWGLGNKHGNVANGSQWLQILGPWSIKSMERIR